MVMEEERDESGGGGGGGGGGETVDQTPESNVVEELVGVVEMVAQFGDYRSTQRKECYNLVRRMKLLLPLFEELRDLDRPFTEKDIACLCNLKKALVMAKKLLKTCNEGSKLYLVRLSPKSLYLWFCL